MSYLSSAEKRRIEAERKRREEQQRASDTSHVTTTTILSDSSGPAHAPLDSCHHTSTDAGGSDGGCGGGE